MNFEISHSMDRQGTAMLALAPCGKDDRGGKQGWEFSSAENKKG